MFRSKALALKLIAKHTSASNAVWLSCPPAHCLLQPHKSEHNTPSLQKEAQRTPWMAQMVQNIVNEFTAELASQSAQLDGFEVRRGPDCGHYQGARIQAPCFESQPDAGTAQATLGAGCGMAPPA